MRRAARMGALLAAALLAQAGAVGLKLRPQGEAMRQATLAALAALSTREVPFTLDDSSGPTLTLGGVGVSDAPFNPDVSARVVVVGGERRLEFNPQGPLTLTEAVRRQLQDEFKLTAWTPEAAQKRFGGADLNGDGAVDLADLALLMENFGKTSPQYGDLNQDRKVDDADLRLFSAQYTTALNAAPAQATPATPAPASTATPASATPPAAAPATAPATTPTPTTPGATPPATVPPVTSPPATTPPGTTPTTP
ncbi:dockerin type I domain-containing protein [Deinococcus sp. Leaf326]|uniref:dockerin type I domain-containing protein n=1 Tax=Deinococcus sp. Leaf326 TaxID=1736338 RepID=UPI000A4DBECC|nr:dockerin type I domain-containing protein [Deinococcus sp. Leaf326]